MRKFLFRVICLVVLTHSVNPSYGQDVEDEYMIELARELFFGIPIKSNLSNSLSLLKQSNRVGNIAVTDNSVMATFISHPFLNIDSYKGNDGSGLVSLELLFQNDQIFERRIIVNNQTDLKAFNTLYNLLQSVSFHTEKSPLSSNFHRESTLFYAKDGRNLAHIELFYNSTVLDQENAAETIDVVLAIYDNTLY